jgi:hypothetical protein
VEEGHHLLVRVDGPVLVHVGVVEGALGGGHSQVVMVEGALLRFEGALLLVAPRKIGAAARAGVVVIRRRG